ncbi:hypothetical protein [Rubinisphaera italica]|uniref:Uncharacterized protein n=1 Tax=Rubinisphaera italica TaxID=2527969 RepID=A0A5C5XL04_9PLAN|nr:hypothetical protein [Rubinisphaera italica]TWT62825.1 hypothetical protein Pan54_35710 [Rubinisphaera italica]
MSANFPKYCLHKHTEQAYILIDGNRHYLGRYDSSDSKELYFLKIAEWHESTANRKEVAPSLAVKEFCTRYLRFVQCYYPKDKVDGGFNFAMQLTVL